MDVVVDGEGRRGKGKGSANAESDPCWLAELVRFCFCCYLFVDALNAFGGGRWAGFGMWCGD